MMPSKSRKLIEQCHSPGCTRKGSFARGLCGLHWRIFKKHCQETGSWSRATPTPKPELPKWTFENPEGEAELILALEKKP
jgi:hypothetical protein